MPSATPFLAATSESFLNSLLTSSAAIRNELVFIDPTVSDYASIVRDLQDSVELGRHFEIVVLSLDRDGLEQVSEHLSRRQNLDAVHFITHGMDGGIKLGSSWLDSQSVQTRPELIAGWSRALRSGADLLFYGCDLASSVCGRDFLEGIRALTHADVAASTDRTAAMVRGGNWNLEYSGGQIETGIALSPSFQKTYTGSLATFTVRSTSDSGGNTLRRAVDDANSTPGVDTIAFALTGKGVQLINLLSALPTITEKVVIDGWTQTGFAGTPLIRIDGASAGVGAGLTFSNTSDGSSVRGLMITRFWSDGIFIAAGADSITVTGCWIGTTGTGSTGVGNGDDGIEVQGSFATIGGVAANERNVITNNADHGLVLNGPGGDFNLVVANYIGLDPDGSTGNGNTNTGIAILAGADNNTIGGATSATRNVISRNHEGIEISSANNRIQGNYIGTDAGGTLNRGNRLGDGIQILTGGNNNTIGGTGIGEGNLIAFSKLNGINVVDGSGNAFMGNQIYSNGGLGIDLNGDGVSPNDYLDPDSGANALKNFPLIMTVVSDGTTITILGSYNGVIANGFRLEFFASATANASGYGEGARYLGFTNVTTNASGDATFSVSFKAAVQPGEVVSSTATDLSNNNSSEFSLAQPVLAPLGLWLSTDGDTTSSAGSGGLSWKDGATIHLANPGLNLGPGVTSGTFSQVFSLNSFAQDGNADLNGLEIVTRTLKIGGATSITLLPGDVLFTTQTNETFGGVATTTEDIILFRPTVAGNYTSGTFSIFLRNPGGTGNNIRDFALVESALTLGGTDLLPGDIIFSMSSATYDKDISLFRPTNVGAGTTSGTLSVLIDGASPNISFDDHIQGLELITETTIIGGQTLLPGQILVSLNNSDKVGSNGLSVTENDVFILNITATGDGTSAGTASMFFRGIDVGLTGGAEQLDALALVSSAGPSLTMPSGSVSYTENASATILDAATTITAFDSTAFQGGRITVDYVTGGLAEDILSIRHQGLAAGQVGISGSNVLYGGIVIGTFSGGMGATPLTINFNSNATVAAVQAVLQNITYQNSSENPDITTRTVRVTAMDNGGRASNQAFQDILIVSVNDAPINTIPGGQSINEDTARIFSTVNGNGISIADVDAAGNIVQLTLTATNGLITLGGLTGLTFITGDGVADATIKFTGTIADIVVALEGMSFIPNANFNGLASVNIQTNDFGNTGTGGPLFDSDSISIVVAAINDAPIHLIPATQGVADGSSLVFSTGAGNRLAVSDVDAGTNPVQVTISITNGVFSLNGAVGLTFFMGDGTADAKMVFSGTLADINAALDGMIVTPTANAAGGASLSIQTNDQGNSGAGGPLTDSDTVTIDVWGFFVTPIIGLTTTEGGSTTSFSVIMRSAPTGDVTIPLSLSLPGEGSLSASSLVFSPGNWNVAQTVTVTGLNDFVDDGNISYFVVLGPAVSPDKSFSGVNPPDVSVTNIDDDTSGFVVTPTAGLFTTEAGGQATFTVRLTSLPSANVVISVASSNLSEGKVNVATLTFTAANWNIDQTVTITGVDEFIADGNQNFTIVLGKAASSDGKYGGLDPADVFVTNNDNDIAGIQVTPLTGLVTTEAGGQATFTVVLTSQPLADVVITLTETQPTEGTLDLLTLTFTSANWNIPRVVTITGLDDFIVDGSVSNVILLNAATSADPAYNGIDAADVSVVNLDDDKAGVVVTPTNGLVTSEAGGAASFTVRLTSQPVANVTITIASSNTGEGTLSKTSLTFTAADWNVDQIVTVTGINDLVDDGDVVFTIVLNPASSADTIYNGMNPADLTVTNTDDDTAGIVVAPTNGLITTEAGGISSFGVRLTSQPLSPVTINITSSNGTEGQASVTSLVFTAANWNIDQLVTVSGVNDFIDDGDVAYAIVLSPASSTDGTYNGMDATDVSVTNTDDDSAGIIVSPTSGLVTTEAGGSASFNIRLTSQPLSPVTINVASSNSGEGTASVTTLTFNAANWNVDQVVTVTGTDDFVDDGDVAYIIVLGPASSSDANYSGRDANDVSVTNSDNDTAGIIVTPTAGLVTTESGGSATFSVRLASQPLSDVTITLASTDISEGLPSTTTLTFTAANWSIDQVVTVTGVDDLLDDGNVTYLVVLDPVNSGDANYNGIDPADVSMVNIDDDSAGVIVSPTAGLITSEAGGTATFKIRLTTQPTASVTFNISTTNAGEGVVTLTSVTFTSADWNVDQIVTITGIDDFIDDGNVVYTIVVGVGTSGDTGYDGINPSDVSVTNNDDDTAGILVTPASGLVTTESGGKATFNVRLTSQPLAPIVVTIGSSNSLEGTVSVASLTFTAANWNLDQLVSVTGADDFIDDGNVAYTIILSPATSADPNYNGFDATDVSATNTDDDTSGIVVSPTTGLVTTEAGGSASFTIRLASQPLAPVTFNISSANLAEGKTSVTSLTFTAANWNVDQVVTVTGVDDFIDDGDLGYTIVLSPANSSDGNYSGFDAADISATNLDNDTAGIVVSPTTGLITTEMGGSSIFSVRLTSQPLASVIINIASSNAGEGTSSVVTLTFTSANWNVDQVVTVNGANDFVDDGDITYFLVLSPAASIDVQYSGMDPADVAVTNIDDDTAGVIVTPTKGLVTSEAGGNSTFSVRLTSQPVSPITINIASSNAGEGTVSITSLTFNDANWNVDQIVTVSGVDDFIDDGNVSYSVDLSSVDSTDAKYAGIDPSDVTVVNTDNDTAGVVVSPTFGLITSEAGTAAVFAVRLTSQPVSPVTINFVSSNATEGLPSVITLTFTAANWKNDQFVTVTGVDDFIDDGDVAYTIAVNAANSSDAIYNGMDAADVSLINTDDDTAGIVVTPTSGLVTTEIGGTASFIVRLTSQPISPVTISLVSSNPLEGMPTVTSITFTAADWNIDHIITIRGVDDFIDEGDVTYTINVNPANSTDLNYGGVDPADVAAVNLDNDMAGIIVTPISGLITTEAGGNATFTVRLTSQPLSSVTINIASTDSTEGQLLISSLTFTSANWNIPQSIVAVGVDDSIDDGNIVYLVVLDAATSADFNYDGRNPLDVSISNLDNDTAGFHVSPLDNLTTTEAGGQTMFSIRLTSQPSADVILTFQSTNNLEGTPDVTTLVFSPSNWFNEQFVSVTGLNDYVDDGDQLFFMRFAGAGSADPLFQGQQVADVGIVNLDDDVAGFVIIPGPSTSVDENGSTTFVTIYLTSQPIAPVTFRITSALTSEVDVLTTNIVFDPTNWATPQVVEFTGVADSIEDDNIPVNIQFGGISFDPLYNQVASSLIITNQNVHLGVSGDPLSTAVKSGAGVPSAPEKVEQLDDNSLITSTQMWGRDTGDGMSFGGSSGSAELEDDGEGKSNQPAGNENALVPVNRPGLSPSSKQLIRRVVAAAMPQEFAAIALPALHFEPMRESMGKMDRDLQEAGDYRTATVQVTVGTAAIASISYVLWSLRGAAWIASAVASSMPAWSAFDPLVLLARKRDDDEDDSLTDLIDTAQTV